MYAYCNNDPVNMLDPSGDAGIWYHLFRDHRYGFIHYLVVTHIAMKYGVNILFELTLDGYGRADVYNKITGEVWEVKHASKIPESRIVQARDQAIKYIGGTHDNYSVEKLGRAGAFNGFFYINCDGKTYEVHYWTPQEGAVLYSVTKVNYQREVEHVYNPAMIPKPQPQQSILFKEASSFSINGSGYLCMSGMMVAATAVMVGGVLLREDCIY